MELSFWHWGILGGILSWFLTWWSVKFFPLLGLLDFPERYGLKRARKPYPGGIMIVFLSLGLISIDLHFWPLILPLMILGGISFIDDRQGVSPWVRLAVHLWLATFLWMVGVKIYYVTNPFAATNFEITQIFPHVAFFLTIFWIVMIQNAINWMDGLPGLSVGVSGIGFLTLGGLGLFKPELAFDPAHQTLTFANLYLAGICVGAFWFYWKGKIILGDTGSQILGFLLAVMAIFSGAKIATTLMVLCIPILDFFWVIFRRLILEKRSPLKGDTKHLHHNLAKHFSAENTSLFLVGTSALFGAIAIFLSGAEKMWAFGVTALLVLSLNLYLFKK